MKLIGTNQLLFYNDDRNVLGASMCTIKENTEASVFVSKENGLELNDKKTKCMVMSRDQHAVQNHNMYVCMFVCVCVCIYIYIYVGKKSFERVEHFRYLGTSLMNQNSIHEEIKCRLQSGNACYYSVQSFYLPVCCPKI